VARDIDAFRWDWLKKAMGCGGFERFFGEFLDGIYGDVMVFQWGF
jgi:hypothetical protein